MNKNLVKDKNEKMTEQKFLFTRVPSRQLHIQT